MVGVCLVLLALARFESAGLGKTLASALRLPLDTFLQAHVGWVAANVLLLFVAPVFLCVVLLQEKPADLGLSLGDARWWGKLLAALLPMTLLAAACLSRLPSVNAFYRAHTAHVQTSSDWALWITSWAAYFFAWELFFRGLLVVRLGKTFGAPAAILLHLLPFVAVHLGPKPTIEIVLAIPGGATFGAIAWRARSMFPAFLLHLSLATSLDLCARASSLPSPLGGG